MSQSNHISQFAITEQLFGGLLGGHSGPRLRLVVITLSLVEVPILCNRLSTSGPSVRHGLAITSNDSLPSCRQLRRRASHAREDRLERTGGNCVSIQRVPFSSAFMDPDPYIRQVRPSLMDQSNRPDPESAMHNGRTDYRRPRGGRKLGPESRHSNLKQVSWRCMTMYKSLSSWQRTFELAGTLLHLKHLVLFFLFAIHCPDAEQKHKKTTQSFLPPPPSPLLAVVVAP